MSWHSFLKTVLSVVVAYKESDVKEKSLLLTPQNGTVRCGCL